VSTRADAGDDIVHVDGYESFWSFCSTKRGYSGVATYVRKGLTVAAKDKPFNNPTFDAEGRCILTDHNSFVLLNVYFPNAGSGDHRLNYKLEFCTAILELCKDLVINQKRQLILVGDLNTAHQEIDTHKPDENSVGFLPEERAWVTSFLSNGFIDTFRHFHPKEPRYTWFDPKSFQRSLGKGWRLDYCIVSNNLLPDVQDSTILLNVLGSDHCPTKIVLNNSPQIQSPVICELSSEYNRKKQQSILSFFGPKEKKQTTENQ